MDVKDKPSLLSVACALTLISEKARHQAARVTDELAKLSLVEIDDHCKAALRIISDLRHRAVDEKPCASDCAGGKHAKGCEYAIAKEGEDSGVLQGEDCRMITGTVNSDSPDSEKEKGGAK
jgi:hypothetical protein